MISKMAATFKANFLLFKAKYKQNIIHTAPTFVAAVEQMLPEVTAKHTLPQYALLLQTAPGRTGQYEAPEQRDQLAVLTENWLYWCHCY